MPVLGADYELARRERNAAREPNRIVMGGEEFTLLPTIPISAAFDLVDAPEPDPDASLDSLAIRAIATFIRLALVDDDQARFDLLLARRTDAVDGHDLIEYGRLLTEVYAGRPTVPPTGSSGGRRPRGATSKPRGQKRAT